MDEDAEQYTRVKMKKTGRVVSVYDGRKWPVIFDNSGWLGLGIRCLAPFSTIFSGDRH